MTVCCLEERKNQESKKPPFEQQGRQIGKGLLTESLLHGGPQNGKSKQREAVLLWLENELHRKWRRPGERGIEWGREGHERRERGGREFDVQVQVPVSRCSQD